MWQKFGSQIIRYRVAILIAIGLVTAFMGYKASQVEIRYDFAMLLPESDSTSVAYHDFKQRFGHDGKVLVIGIQDEDLFELERFQLWYDLGQELLEHKGTTELISAARCADLVKNDSLNRFEIKPLVTERPSTQAEVDSIHARLMDLPFYHDYLITEDYSSIMGVTLSEEIIDSKERNVIVSELVEISKKYEEKLNKTIHFSGLPFIRSAISSMVSKELGQFMGLAGLISFLIMLIFFRSFKVVFFSIVVVAVGVVWAFGIIGLLGYKLSILTGLLPPVLIVIGIANCIFLLNKYHSEYKRHQKKALALTRMVKRVGQAILFTNATTASGFATFALLESELMHEFGVVASLCIMAMFFMCLLLVPIIFSYVGAPRARHTKHLDSKFSEVFIGRVIQLVLSHRTKVYWVFGVLMLVAAYGIYHIKVTGNLVDDLPDSHRVVKDLRFFESNFGGVMPFEVQIDALKPKKAITVKTLKKIEELEKVFAEDPAFAKPISIVSAMKFARQAYFNGLPEMYQLPSNRERSFILKYTKASGQDGKLMEPFLDSTQQYARISAQMKDVGTDELERMLARVQPAVDSIFEADKYEVTLTGTSVAFLRGTEYLVTNLFTSLVLAVIIIVLIMARMFRSWRMVSVSLLPNLIPLLFTAALMGYLEIPIKPSTILVFSIAFGISVDDTIHFLAKYRQELDLQGWNIRRSVLVALREVGVSMVYTSIVLFSGFSIFISSTFGGTKALGMLVSFTLLVAMFSNLVLLPSLLLTLERKLTTKAFKDASVEVFDEEEDIELEQLTVKREE